MRSLLQKAGEQGLLMFDIPTHHGGLGVSKAGSTLIGERAFKLASFAVAWGAHCGIGTLPLLFYGTDEQKSRYLPRLMSGELIAAYALTEPGSGSDALGAKTKATRLANGDYALTASSPMIDAGNPALPVDGDGSPADVGAFSYNPAYIPASTGFGAGCGPTAGWYWEPIVGQSYYELHLSGALPSAPALLLLGISQSLWKGLPLPFDLGLAGAPGCALLTGPVVTFGVTADANGEALLHLAIPPNTDLAGATFYVQWAAPVPGANPLGMLFSEGIKVIVKL